MYTTYAREIPFTIKISHPVKLTYTLLNVGMYTTFAFALSVIIYAQAHLTASCVTRIMDVQSAGGNNYYRLSDGTGFWSRELYSSGNIYCIKPQ